MIVEDRTQRRRAAEIVRPVMGPDRQGQPDSGLSQNYTLFDVSTPRVFADVDREKADMLGVPPQRVFEALQVYLGSAFINDFNLLGPHLSGDRPADAPFRANEADIAICVPGPIRGRWSRWGR